MSRIRVAFLDDGINTSSYDIMNITANIQIMENGKISVVRNTDIPSDSHGTICTAIFNKYCLKKDIDIIGIKILDNDTEKGNVQQLIIAIKWCIENNVNLINCSLGTTNYVDFLIIKKAVNSAVENRIVIVAAQSNNDLYTLPACLDNVIGVKKDLFYCDGNYKWRWYPFDNIEIAVCGIHQLIKKDNSVFWTSNSNSYAVPIITAYIANIIYDRGIMSIDELKLFLENNARTIVGEHIPNFVPYPWNLLSDQNHERSEYFDIHVYSDVIKKYLINIEEDIEIPVINISDDDYKFWKIFINKLIGRLQEERIYYHIISDVIDDLEISAIIFPLNFDKTTFYKNIYKKYKNDIVILHQHEKIQSDISIKIADEIVIECDGNKKKFRDFNIYNVNDCIEYLFYLLTE